MHFNFWKDISMIKFAEVFVWGAWKYIFWILSIFIDYRFFIDFFWKFIEKIDKRIFDKIKTYNGEEGFTEQHLHSALLLLTWVYLHPLWPLVQVSFSSNPASLDFK